MIENIWTKIQTDISRKIQLAENPGLGSLEKAVGYVVVPVRKMDDSFTRAMTTEALEQNKMGGGICSKTWK